MTMLLDEFVSRGKACDFCRDSPIINRYPTRNFEWDGGFVFGGENGWWACCGRCSRLVDRKQWSTLTERCAERYIQERGIPAGYSPEQIRTHFANLVRCVRKHMMR